MEKISKQQAQRATGILEAGKELILASIRPDGTPHASTASYASDGLLSYCAISIDSQKAHNIRHDSRVAYVVNVPYSSWAEIRGVSVEATATMLDDPLELRLVSTLLLRKYPEFTAIIANTAALPWPGMLFIALRPLRMSLLDYAKAFGHTEYFSIDANAAPPF